MRSGLKFALLTALVAAMLVPNAAALGSAAHPHAHTFYGVSAANVVVAASINDPITAEAYLLSRATVVGTCVDSNQDGDLDISVGGTCFTYETLWGNDAGTTQVVHLLADGTSRGPIYFVCVDVDGDGVCSEDGADETNLCYAPGGNGSTSLYGGSCEIYLNPAAANRAVYVVVLPGAVVEDGSIIQSVAVSGRIWYE